MKSQLRKVFGAGGRKPAAAFIAALAFTAVAYAECYSGGCAEVYVDELYPDSGGAWIQTSGNETLANCTVDSNIFLRLSGGPGFDAMYATLLAAQISEKKVGIRIIEGSNPCTITYVRLNRNTW